MQKFQKYSSRLVMISALIWILLVFSKQLTIGQSYFIIGVLFTYIGIQNILLLNIGQRTGNLTNKITHYIQHHGEQKGILMYVCINILLFLCIGIITMVSSFSMF